MGFINEERAAQLEDRMIVAMERQLTRIVEQREQELQERDILKEREHRNELRLERRREEQEALHILHEEKQAEIHRRHVQVAAHQRRKQEAMYKEEVEKLERAAERHRAIEEQRHAFAEKHRADFAAKTENMRQKRQQVDRRTQARRNEIFDRIRAWEERNQMQAEVRKQMHDEMKEEAMAKEQERRARLRAVRQSEQAQKMELIRDVEEKNLRSEMLRQQKDAYVENFKRIHEESLEKRRMMHNAILKSNKKGGDVAVLRKALDKLLRSHKSQPDLLASASSLPLSSTPLATPPERQRARTPPPRLKELTSQTPPPRTPPSRGQRARTPPPRSSPFKDTSPRTSPACATTKTLNKSVSAPSLSAVQTPPIAEKEFWEMLEGPSKEASV